MLPLLLEPLPFFRSRDAHGSRNEYNTNSKALSKIYYVNYKYVYLYHPANVLLKRLAAQREAIELAVRVCICSNELTQTGCVGFEMC